MRFQRYAVAVLALSGALGCGGGAREVEGSSTGPGDPPWSRGFAPQGTNSYAVIDSVATNAEGTVAIVGDLGGTLSLDAFSLSATFTPFVAVFDPGGAVRWAKALPLAAGGMRVAVDAAGYVVLAGRFEGSVDLGGGPLKSAGGADIAVARLDPGGDVLWSERFGDPSDQEVTGVAVTPAGEIVLTGDFTGALDFGLGPLTGVGGSTLGDFYVAKLDTAGKALWSAHFGAGVSSHEPISASPLVAVGEGGEIALAVTTFGIALGAPWHTQPSTSEGAYVAKLDAGGAPLWGAALADPLAQVGVTAVALDAAGDVAITGTVEGPLALGKSSLSGPDPITSVFVAAFDPTGTPRWGRGFGSVAVASPNPYGVGIGTQGNVALVTGYEGTMDFGTGPVVNAASGTTIARFDASGAPLSADSLGHEASLFVNAVAPVPGGSDLVLGGGYSGQVDLGQGSFPMILASGDVPMFLARLPF
jgi:hypothetical protein